MENNAPKNSTKFLRGLTIFAMVVALFFLGIYLNYPSQVKAGAMKFFGFYGLGKGLYPIPGSQSGTIQRASFNGQSSLFLECAIQQPMERVFEYYKNILEKESSFSSWKNTPPSLNWDQGKGLQVFEKGVLKVKGAYGLLGTITSQGENLGVVLFPISSGSTRYYLYRSFQEKGLRASLIFSPPFGSPVFALEMEKKSQGLYSYICDVPMEKARESYQKLLISKGWKIQSNYQQALNQSSPSLAMHRENLEILVFFQPLSKGKKSHLSIVLKPREIFEKS